MALGRFGSTPVSASGRVLYLQPPDSVIAWQTSDSFEDANSFIAWLLPSGHCEPYTTSVKGRERKECSARVKSRHQNTLAIDEANKNDVVQN